MLTLKLSVYEVDLSRNERKLLSKLLTESLGYHKYEYGEHWIDISVYCDENSLEKTIQQTKQKIITVFSQLPTNKIKYAIFEYRWELYETVAPYCTEEELGAYSAEKIRKAIAPR